MKIGIISDSHDQVGMIKKAVAVFNNEKVKFVYHCGDLCSPFVLHLLAELNCPVKIVFGNNDADIFKHIKMKPDNISFHDMFYTEEINGRKICLTHGDPEENVKAIFESKKYDLLLRGHNHVAEIKRNDTIMINPGNLIGSFSEKTSLWTKPSVAVYDFERNEARIIKI